MSWDEVAQILENGRRDGLFSGCSLAAGDGDDPVCINDGLAQREPELRQLAEVPIFDLGSLTKVICTTTLVMQAVQEGVLGLDQTIKEVLPDFPAPYSAEVTVRHLMSHSSGLAATRPYYESLEGAEDMLSRIAIDPLKATPGKVTIYSDLGFIILGAILERKLGARLDELFDQRVARPLGLGEIFFVPLHDGAVDPVQDAERFVATERCRWRGRVLSGEVHDPNAWAMGGVSGHAGLFGTARDVYRFGRLATLSWQGKGPLNTEMLGDFARRAMIVDGSDRALGWDTPTEGISCSGGMFGPDSVGHLGYVGTSLWIDLAKGRVVVLLTNRVHPDDTAASRQAMRAFRPGLHDAVWSALEESA